MTPLFLPHRTRNDDGPSIDQFDLTSPAIPSHLSIKLGQVAHGAL